MRLGLTLEHGIAAAELHQIDEACDRFEPPCAAASGRSWSGFSSGNRTTFAASSSASCWLLSWICGESWVRSRTMTRTGPDFLKILPPSRRSWVLSPGRKSALPARVRAASTERPRQTDREVPAQPRWGRRGRVSLRGSKATRSSRSWAGRNGDRLQGAAGRAGSAGRAQGDSARKSWPARPS